MASAIKFQDIVDRGEVSDYANLARLGYVSSGDVARYHAAADRVFRAAGNHAGRGRLDSTAKLREQKPPRGLILSTGEDIPRGQSVRARLLILELPKGSVQTARLTECQDDAQAGRYAEAMSGFVQWIAATGVALFGEVAKMYEEGYLGRENQIAKPTREKEEFYLTEYIVPRWGNLRLNQIHPKAVEDWLHTTFDSWWTMHGVRAIMSRVFYYAEGHGLWEEGKRSPASKAKLGKKHYKYERRILSFDETARVLARLEEPNLLVIETCIATGARISEVLGLIWRNVNQEAGTIKIEQRVWHQEIGRPKSEDSKRILGIGELVERLRTKAMEDGARPQAFVFQQKRAPGKPLWDSGVRDALHQAAEAEGCDFPGLGPHSFRRANITWRQQVGGSAIEASKIVGHSDLEMTGEYTFVTAERQNELTRRIQDKLAQAIEQVQSTPLSPSPEVQRSPGNSKHQSPMATTLIQ